LSEGLLLDTHCWIWMHLGLMGSFRSEAIRAIRVAAHNHLLHVSAISAWEIGLLESKGRLELDLDCELWIERALTIPGLNVAPITPAIAVRSTRLPGDFHGDPADRILVATARVNNACLLTKDQKILDYARQKHVRVMQA
jgi:PIN domain nuclease of toxin-antitoxin system